MSQECTQDMSLKRLVQRNLELYQMALKTADKAPTRDTCMGNLEVIDLEDDNGTKVSINENSPPTIEVIEMDDDFEASIQKASSSSIQVVTLEDDSEVEASIHEAAPPSMEFDILKDDDSVEEAKRRQERLALFREKALQKERAKNQRHEKTYGHVLKEPSYQTTYTPPKQVAKKPQSAAYKKKQARKSKKCMKKLRQRAAIQNKLRYQEVVADVKKGPFRTNQLVYTSDYALEMAKYNL